MSSGNNEHAVVVGGGVPNLLTARALSERLGAIIVIERDRPQAAFGRPHSGRVDASPETPARRADERSELRCRWSSSCSGT
jgi:glycine/D-amino acid oxidase-like deaminating enzyme